MLMKVRAVLLLALALIAAPAHAQVSRQVSNCVNGVPAFQASDPTAAQEMLNRLLWRQAHVDYVSLQARYGAVAALDSIAMRGDRLLELARGGTPSTLDPVITLVRSRTATTRGSLKQLIEDGKSLRNGQVVDAASLRLGAAANPGTVMLGVDTVFTIDESNRAVAVAVCATASTLTRYLEYLNQPELRRVAIDYAAAEAQWTLFVKNGYSMTLWERLAASCRLGFVGRLISPVRDCDRSPGRSLAPPRNQWIFLHPVGGLMPYFRNDSTYSELAVVEFYGYLRHSYTTSEMQTWGVSVASAVPRTGTAMLGGVLHTPWGSAGVFADRNKRAQYALTADALGWISKVRDPMRKLQRVPLEKALENK